MVLKAPHHGSATSSTAEFLERIRPAVAIFSAGRNNRFGHPARVVVERYRAMGTTMFSTAEDGAVILDTDGESGGDENVERAGGDARQASTQPSLTDDDFSMDTMDTMGRWTR